MVFEKLIARAQHGAVLNAARTGCSVPADW